MTVRHHPAPGQGDDPQEAGRAWMRGDLSSDEYFAMARRGNRYPARQPSIWQRLLRRAKRTRSNEN